MIPAILAALEGLGASAAGATAGAGQAAGGFSGFLSSLRMAKNIGAPAGTPPPLPSQFEQKLNKAIPEMTKAIEPFNVAASAATEVFGGLGKIVKLATLPIKLIEAGFHALYSTVNFLPSKILEVQQMIVSTGTLWVKALAAPIDTVKQLGDVVAQFVKLANPASVTMFNYKVENTFATLGHILQPVFDALSRSAEKMGDLFARLKPALAPAMKAVEGLIGVFTDRFVDTMELVAPLIEAVSYSFLVFAKGIEAIERPITAVLRKFNELRAGIFSIIGFPTGYDRNAKSDVAVREPRYTGVEEMQRELAKNALMASAGAGKGQQPQDTTSLLKGILDWLKDAPEQIVKAIISHAAEIAAAIRGGLTPSLPGIPGFGGGIPSVADIGGILGQWAAGQFRAQRQE